MKLTRVFIILQMVLLIASCNQNERNKNKIDNDFISIVYDSSTQHLELTSKLNDEVTLNLSPVGTPGSCTQCKVIDSIFGKGNSLVISNQNGGSCSFTLYDSNPFAFVSQQKKNISDKTIDIGKLNTLSFSVDLGKPVGEMKTHGTGGLLDPDKNPGSYVFLTTVDPASRIGIVTGWLTSNKGCGVLLSDTINGRIQINSRIDYGHYILSTGKSEELETLMIGYFNDARLGEEKFAASLAKYHHIMPRPRTAIYCSWYSNKNGGAGSEKSSIELADYISKNLKSYGLGGIQIDDLWQGGGKYNGPQRGFDRTNPEGGYPKGMKKTAAAIRDAGLSAGIWWIPFARNHQAPEYADRQHWFAYRTNGQPYETNWGGTSLDLSRPEVLDHVADFAKRMESWGFDYFKMDALWTGTVTEHVYINDGYKEDNIGNCKPLYNPEVTQIEAFRNGLKTIRKATGNRVFLSGCNLSQNMRIFGASIGLVDAMRIGPDFNHDGEGIRTGVIRASRLYFLNGRVWWNDPDPTMVREGEQSGINYKKTGIGGITRAHLLPSFVALTGQFFLSSDWLPDLPQDRIEIVKRCLASHNGIARPVDIFNRKLPAIWLTEDDQTGIQRKVIGIFNWGMTSEQLGCSLDWAGVNSDKSYYAFDFWAKKPMAEISGSFSYKLPAESCKLIALRAKSNHPVVVSSSQHVSQGMIDILSEEWKDGILSGTSKIIGGDDYELRIAGLDDGSNWILDQANIINNNDLATIEVLPQEEPGWLRVLIKTRENINVNWQLVFNGGI